MSDFEFDDIESMQRNPEIEGEKGTELGLPNGIVLIVLAASDANPKWRAQNDAIATELRRLSNARAPNEKVRAYLSRKYAECLIKDWRGVKTHGVEVPFSVDACTAFLRKAHDAYAAVDTIVYETKNFRGARVEAVVATAGE